MADQRHSLQRQDPRSSQDAASLQQLLSRTSQEHHGGGRQGLRDLEQQYRKSRTRLILNLGNSYNQITLDRLQKTKEEIRKRRLDQMLYQKMYSESDGPDDQQDQQIAEEEF